MTDLMTCSPREVLLLGAAQDAGLPQCGCDCPNCQAARAAQAESPVCLAVIDHRARGAWLIDATPAFAAQFDRLRRAAPECALRGIFLTHTHMGHYTGLMYLGREAMNTRDMPVYASASTCAFLRTNAPWSQLVNLHNIRLIEIQPEVAVSLSESLTITAYSAPHRAEYSDTLAFEIRGQRGALFYCPDIDRWEFGPHDAVDFLSGFDHALLDATFFDGAELPGRNLAEIPHPFVRHTCERLRSLAARITLVHLNHSNPLWHDGPERAWVIERGFMIGRTGAQWFLE